MRGLGLQITSSGTTEWSDGTSTPAPASSSGSWLSGTVGNIIGSLGTTAAAVAPTVLASAIAKKLAPAVAKTKVVVKKVPGAPAAPAKSGTPSWVMPVAIGGGALLLVGVLVMTLKK